MRHGRRRTVVIPPARPRIGKVGRFDLAHGGTVFLDEVGTLAARPPGEVRALRERGRSSVSAACAPRRWNPSTIAARAAPDLSPVRRTLRSAAGSNARCRPLEAEVRVRVSTQVDILHFSTTWSARTSTDCGIVSPSALYSSEQSSEELRLVLAGDFELMAFVGDLQDDPGVRDDQTRLL